MQRTAVNPWPWSLQFGFHQGELVERHRRALYCAGQSSVDAEGRPKPPGDMAGQLTLTLDNLSRKVHDMTNASYSVRRARLPRILVLTLLAVACSASAASATATRPVGGLPPAFGKLCGHVPGASWHFHSQTGTQYNVTGVAAACAVALKSVGALTKQTPHAGVGGPQTLIGPNGFRCAGSGIKLAHAGFCGKGTDHFVWAPRLA